MMALKAGMYYPPFRFWNSEINRGFAEQSICPLSISYGLCRGWRVPCSSWRCRSTSFALPVSSRRRSFRRIVWKAL